MDNQTILNMTKDYFCYGVTDDCLCLRMDYVRGLPSGSRVVDFGTGQGRTSIAMGLANPSIEVFTFDMGQRFGRDLIDHHYVKRNIDRIHDCKAYNVYFTLGSSLDVYPSWDWPLHGLCIDASGRYDLTQQELSKWARHLVPGGWLFLQSYHYPGHGGETWKYPGLRQAMEEYMQTHHYQIGQFQGNTQVFIKQ